ncbi:MAG: baseplate J/gp47 family protein [Kofleriaceae bacterium]
MTFRPLTLVEQHEILVALHKAVRPEDDVSEGSYNSLSLLTIAAAVTDGHAHHNANLNDMLPDTAEGDELRRWAKIRGVVLKGATPARKSSALRVTGTAGEPVPGNTELVHVSGLRYKIVGDELVGALGYVDCDVVAIDTGRATRLNKGETLRFLTPLPNIEEEAELQLALDEDGFDAEQDSEIQARLLSRFRDPPRGGTRVDYEQWALEQTGIAAAFAYPLRNGLGTVDLAALHAGSGTARLLQPGEIAALQATIDQLRPVGVKGCRVLTVVPKPVDVEVLILPDGLAEHAFDWHDQPTPTVSAWTPATRVLKFAGGARPSSLKAGDRLTIAQGPTGRERVVESLGPGADEVTLEVDPVGDTPAVGNTIYAGGPLVAPARAAIQALFDALGTANPDAKRYGPWEGNLRIGTLGDAAKLRGVLDRTVVAPTANVTALDPPYPANDVIELLIAGRILVRRQQ